MNCRDKIKEIEDKIEYLHHVEYWCWEHAMYRELREIQETIKELLREKSKLEERCMER